MSLTVSPTVGTDFVYEVTDLTVSFKRDDVWHEVVHGVSYGVKAGEVVALVGESGSGKSVSSLAGLGLLGRNARVTGSVRFKGQELIGAPEEEIRSVRGNEIALIFQEPMTALHPVFTVGQQLVRVLRSRAGHTAASAKARALELLTMVELPDPQRAFDSYPHQLSGGQRQRALIALCISCDPSMLIADEPTTALDVTVQAEILELLRRLRMRLNGAAVLITHDLGIVADSADHVVVMQDGHVVEIGRVNDVFADPQHPYTKQLLAAVPRLRVEVTEPAPAPAPKEEPLLRLDNASIEYSLRGGGTFRAVNEVSFEIGRGEIVGLVGESGSGKTTIAKAVIGLEKFKSGSVTLDGTELVGTGANDMRRLRRRIGFVFQDPGSSLNPRRTIGDSVAEPLRLAGLRRAEIGDRVREALDSVHLPDDAMGRYPYQLSGGQRQRVGIARAIITRPDLLIADEPTSALDVSVQQRVLEIFEELQAGFGFACLFVSHDLGVIDRLSDRIVVLRRGELIEVGTPDEVIRNPRDPYTQRLVQAVPVPDPVVQRERRRDRLAAVGRTDA